MERLDVDNDTKAKLKNEIKPDELNLNGGTFEVTLEDGKKYTLTYSAAGAEVTASTPTTDKTDTGKKPEEIDDVKDNTVTGTAYVTSGTISWTAKGQKGEYTATVGDASVLTPPPGATPEYKDGKLTGYTVTSTDKDGNTVTTTYTPTYGDASGMTEEQRKELAVQA